MVLWGLAGILIFGKCLAEHQHDQPRTVVLETWDLLKTAHDDLDQSAKNVFEFRNELSSLREDYQVQERLWNVAIAELEAGNEGLLDQVSKLRDELKSTSLVAVENKGLQSDLLLIESEIAQLKDSNARRKESFQISRKHVLDQLAIHKNSAQEASDRLAAAKKLSIPPPSSAQEEADVLAARLAHNSSKQDAQEDEVNNALDSAEDAQEILKHQLQGAKKLLTDPVDGQVHQLLSEQKNARQRLVDLHDNLEVVHRNCVHQLDLATDARDSEKDKVEVQTQQTDKLCRVANGAHTALAMLVENCKAAGKSNADQ